MKILVAEDEQGIAEVYRLALEDRGHDVTVTMGGLECIEVFDRALSQLSIDPSKDQRSSQQQIPFDVVILDYMMPKKDGMEVAKHIISRNPHQRIIFASAYVKETLQDSIKQLSRVVELLQKPFEMDVLVDIVEDRAVYEELQKMQVRVKMLKEHNITHDELVDLLAGLKRILKKNNPLPQCLNEADNSSSSNKSIEKNSSE